VDKIERLFRAMAVLAVLISVGILPISCQPEKKAEGKLSVVATIFPVYDMARAVGGPDAAYEILVRPGTEAHTFEPTPVDIKKLEQADIFIYNGAQMEPWVDGLLAGISNPRLLVVDSSAGITLLNAQEEGFVSGGESKKEGALDPHIWLDFDNAKKQIDNITEAFIKKDGGHAPAYRERGQAYKKKFDELDALYREGLKGCRTTEIVSSGHFSFAYLARRYGLSLVSVFGISPDAEPTPGRVRSVIELIRQKKARYIFAEEMVEPRVAETIQEETGAQILFLSPGDELPREKFDRGITLVDLMKDNLQQLKRGLQCP
jgi:zinc transport system substrate-binding protein